MEAPAAGSSSFTRCNSQLPYPQTPCTPLQVKIWRSDMKAPAAGPSEAAAAAPGAAASGAVARTVSTAIVGAAAVVGLLL